MIGIKFSEKLGCWKILAYLLCTFTTLIYVMYIWRISRLCDFIFDLSNELDKANIKSYNYTMYNINDLLYHSI